MFETEGRVKVTVKTLERCKVAKGPGTAQREVVAPIRIEDSSVRSNSTNRLLQHCEEQEHIQDPTNSVRDVEAHKSPSSSVRSEDTPKVPSNSMKGGKAHNTLSCSMKGEGAQRNFLQKCDEQQHT